MPHLNPPEILDQALVDASEKVEVGAYYYHYKSPGKRYQVIDLAVLEANEEVAVLYRITDGARPGTLWIRPLASFLEEVDVEGTMVPRFQKVS